MRAYPPGYYPGKLVQPAPQPGFSLRRLFGVPDEPPPVYKPVVRPRRPAPAPVPVVHQERPKPNATTQVVVFGDALAGYAEEGIAGLYSDSEDVAVVRKTRDEGGLMRSDPDEWPKFIKEVLDGGQKITLAVVMIGAKDRVPLKDQSGEHDPLSNEWREAYRQRIDALLRIFKDRGIPVVWIGLPPMKNDAVSEDLLAMNEIYRESVERNGGTYVDIWPGFVDEDNRYTATGPDVDGQPAKLRANDGVLFTKAGARKVAHFADAEIKRIIANGQGGVANAAPPHPIEGSPNATPASSSIEAFLPAPPEAAAPVSLPSKPLIGPVLPLSRPEVTPGGTLISTKPKLTGDQVYPVQRALRNGIAPNSRPGRADDFRWPPS
ncbi:SGNH/GDSL hydrolase family protein [Microvirga sp. 2TAF3]|uniref:SGNH/GDSL hydrolase family protein n=1 Tax=Microvirga sp. 2TAF3 TaxID=3233014 RepID=UPI003F96E3B5